MKITNSRLAMSALSFSLMLTGCKQKQPNTKTSYSLPSVYSCAHTTVQVDEFAPGGLQPMGGVRARVACYETDKGCSISGEAWGSDRNRLNGRMIELSLDQARAKAAEICDIPNP